MIISTVPFTLNIELSTNYGLSFTIITKIASTGLPDFPKIAFGPDGTGDTNGFALWFCFDDFSNATGDTVLKAGFLPVTGFNSFDTAGIMIHPLDSVPPNTGGLADIFVGPSGQVYLIENDFTLSGSTSSATGDQRIYLHVNPTGTVGYSSSSFSPRRAVAFSNIVAASTSVPWNPKRDISAVAYRAMGYDNNLKRLYFSYVDMQPNKSLNDRIFVMWSDNDGQSWSEPFVVAQGEGSRGMPTLAVEPNSGLISLGWYDPRGDPTQESVNYRGTVFALDHCQKAFSHGTSYPASHFNSIGGVGSDIQISKDILNARKEWRLQRHTIVDT